MAKRQLPQGMTRRENGTIMYRFSVDGKRYTVTGSCVKECREKEMKRRIEIESQPKTRGPEQTISHYLSKWLEGRLSIKGSTRLTYGKLINRMCNQQIDEIKFGELKLSEIQAQDVREMQKGLLSEGLMTRTVNDSLSLLRKALEAAVNERIITWNPTKGVERLKRTEKPARDTIHRALSSTEWETFIKAAENSTYKNLYTVLYYTGLRIGEASALTVWDISADQINVNKTVTKTDAGYIISPQTKTEAGKRIVPLRQEAKQAIEDQKQRNVILYGEFDSGRPLFLMPKGGIIRGDRVNEEIKRICSRAGIEYFSCHALRASFITRCVESGMPLKDLMEIAGHSDVQMTMGLYAHGNEEKKQESMKAVNFG